MTDFVGLIIAGSDARWLSLATRLLQAEASAVCLVGDSPVAHHVAARCGVSCVSDFDLRQWLIDCEHPAVVAIEEDVLLPSLSARALANRALEANDVIVAAHPENVRGLKPGQVLSAALELDPVGKPHKLAAAGVPRIRLIAILNDSFLDAAFSDPNSATAPIFGVDRSTNRSLLLLPEMPSSKGSGDLRAMSWEIGRAVLRGGSIGNRIRQAGAAIAGLFRKRPEIHVVKNTDRFSVTYVLDELVVAGGTQSVIQLVNELILLGVDARIAARFVDPAIYRWMPLLTRPMVYESLDSMGETLPPCDVAVATMWTTAATVADLKFAGTAKAAAYFVQDYEAWFYDKGDERRDLVRGSYARIPNRIVKSQWLADKLKRHAADSTQIALGLDLDLFSSGLEQPREKSVIAMARPGTERRGFGALVQVLEQIHERFPDTKITLFGSGELNTRKLPFPCVNEGIVEDQQHLAQLYGSHRVFIDTSRFQGFGRCALEAMACGCACVLSDQGGVNAYAKHGGNSLLANPDDIFALVDHVDTLLTEDETAQRLSVAAMQTAQQFDLRTEAEATLAYFKGL